MKNPSSNHFVADTSERPERWQSCRRRMLGALVLLVVPFLGGTCAASDPVRCDLCNRLFVEISFRVQDQVSGETKVICHVCSKSGYRCYACGVPIIKDRLSLEDGRHYCARDAKAAITDTNAVLRLARETDATVRRQLQDQLTLPEESTLDVRVIDRLELQNWYKLPGHDHQCPNILGLYETITNNAARIHRIHVLSGQTQGETRATYAHELTHAWLADNLSPERKLGRHAAEGFCELISYLLAGQLNDTRAQQVVSSNAYTRGQFVLLRGAYERYSLQDVVNWVKFGREPEVDAADIDMVRRAEPPPRPMPRNYVRYVSPEAAAVQEAALATDEFELKGIVGAAGRRTALINGKAFLEGEKHRVRKGTNLVEIRCVEITADAATIEETAGGEQKVLSLSRGGRP